VGDENKKTATLNSAWPLHLHGRRTKQAPPVDDPVRGRIGREAADPDETSKGRQILSTGVGQVGDGEHEIQPALLRLDEWLDDVSSPMRLQGASIGTVEFLALSLIF
jgi:hypothetical protein